MSVIRGNTTATPMKRPDMAETDEKKSSYIKNNPLAGLTVVDDGKVLSVVDGKPAFVEDHTLENAEKYTDEQIEATKEAIGKEVDERCQGLENGGVAKIKTTSGQMLTIFVGTHAEYEAYVAVNGTNGLFALITDDTTKQDLDNALRSLEEKVTMLQEEVFRNYILSEWVTKAPTLCNLFSTPPLTNSGYYYIELRKSKQVYSFGLVYWAKGCSMTLTSGNDQTSVEALITSVGTIVCKENGSTINSNSGYELYVNKLEVTA